MSAGPVFTRAQDLKSDPEAHPRDGRSAAVRLTPDLDARVAEASAALVAEIDALVEQLCPSGADAVLGSSRASPTPLNATHLHRALFDFPARTAMNEVVDAGGERPDTAGE